MAATIASVGHSSVDVNGTSHGIVRPSGITAGDLLITLLASDGSTTWSGWLGTQLFNNTTGASNQFQARYEIATGSEIDYSLTSTASEKSESYCVRITGWHGTTPPESADTFTSSGNADPPSLTPSWGSADQLLIVAACLNGAADVTAFPTNYADNQFEHATSGAGSINFAFATRAATVSSENPGAFANASEAWYACTIAVRPAAAGATGNPWHAYANQ